MSEPSPSGRPRDLDIDRKLHKALVRLLVDHGASNVSVERLVREAGTSKPAFYRRYKRVSDMIPSLFAAEYDLTEPEPQGSLRADLRAFQERQARILGSPLALTGMAWYLMELSTIKGAGQFFVDEYQEPRVAIVRRIIDRAVAAGELSTHPIDAHAVMDILVGPLFFRSTVPAIGPIDDKVIDQTVITALRYIHGEQSESPS